MRRNFAQILKEAKIDIKSESQYREFLEQNGKNEEDVNE